MRYSNIQSRPLMASGWIFGMLRHEELASVRAGRVALLFVIPCLTALAAGCSSSRDAARQQLDDVRSWTATTQLAQRQFRDGALPVVFAQGIARSADRALAESQRAFDRMSLSAERQADARGALDYLSRATRDLTGAALTR